ncbi:hypothetical protein LXL04_005133 [Taraxacum kok-saghyz]
MATQLTHSHFFLPSYKHFFADAPESRLCRFPVRHRRSLLVADCASPPTESSVRVAGRKPARTNADLCNDLREFISDAGLPDGHVPSLKELSQHGRQDLANLVRRRGYKLIKELLAASQELKVTDSDVDETLTDNQDKTSTEEDELTGLDENETKLTEDVILLNEETSNSNTFDDDTESDTESFFSVDNSPKPSLQEKVMNFIQNGELEAIEGKDISSNDQQLEDPESTNTVKEDEAEINRIKVMLHHKELELSQLKEQIEKNKKTLSELQAKAETEINKAQKLVLDKDAELLAAEESLSGLKQVEVDYWGEGETVEVAGSFNGWHHGVKLDPQPSSNITDPVELRFPTCSFLPAQHNERTLGCGGQLCGCTLGSMRVIKKRRCLQIKFIVDGKWMIDPMKEVVARGSIHNNVLRVDR